MPPRARPPAASASLLFILRAIYMGTSIELLIFTIYLQVHASTGLFMPYAAAVWGIVIATAEMTGLASPHDTRVKRLSPSWMVACEPVSAGLFAAALGMTIESFRGISSQIIVAVWPNEQYVNIPLNPWRMGSLGLEVVGGIVALLFVVISCIEECHKTTR
jgi:hypothetical protein